jgi:hypothetical protein
LARRASDRDPAQRSAGPAANGKLLLIESVIPKGNDRHFGKVIDMEMLAQPLAASERPPSGRSCSTGRLRLTRILETETPIAVIEEHRPALRGVGRNCPAPVIIAAISRCGTIRHHSQSRDP